jgi:hypothetical protein
VRFYFQTGQQAEKNDDGQGRNQCGEPPTPERVIDLGPVDDNLLANGACWQSQISSSFRIPTSEAPKQADIVPFNEAKQEWEFPNCGLFEVR